MDARKILDNLTLDDYEHIFISLGVEEITKTDKYWMLPTLCHNLDISEASKKLYFYIDTKTTYCFTECQKSRDIVDLISARWELEGKSGYGFVDIIKYICEVCGIDINESNTRHIINQPSWKKRLSVYQVAKKSQYLGKRYDKNILNHFLSYHPQTFIDDGISEETMNKFGVAFYAPSKQITIPVYDLDGELVGIHCRNLDANKVAKGYKWIPLKLKCGLDYRFKTNEILYGLNMNLPYIKHTKQIQLFESPKAVLQMDTMFDNQTSAVAMFGMNLGLRRRNQIIETGISEVIIGIDKDYESEDSQEFEAYIRNVQKIAKMFKGYCKCSVLYDRMGLLGYKDAPTDKGIEVYKTLYKERVVVDT